MSLCLLHSLLHYEPQLPLSEQIFGLHLTIIHSYIAWMQTNPFDIGDTTQLGLQIASSMLQDIQGTQLSPEEVNDVMNNIQSSVK